MNEVKTEAVCAVVVTFNRKDLLIDCLVALSEQTRHLDAVLIIDNASTDKTPENLLDRGYISNLPSKNSSDPFEDRSVKIIKNSNNENLKVIYVRMNENTGGAGGFFEGVSRGFELGYDWLWLMDDDGIAEKDALQNLLIAKNENIGFLNSLVIDKDEPSNLSFGLFDFKNSNLIKTHSEALSHAENGLIWNTVNPFNGTLISKNLIRDIGCPKKEMFIWGDEVEYMHRALKFGYGVATAVNAIHYHPRGRVETVHLLGGRYRLNYQKSRLKNYCDMRNRAYIQWRYGQKNKLLKHFLAYTYYFLSEKKLDEWLFYLKSTYDGLFALWGNEKKYLN